MFASLVLFFIVKKKRQTDFFFFFSAASEPHISLQKKLELTKENLKAVLGHDTQKQKPSSSTFTRSSNHTSSGVGQGKHILYIFSIIQLEQKNWKKDSENESTANIG